MADLQGVGQAVNVGLTNAGDVFRSILSTAKRVEYDLTSGAQQAQAAATTTSDQRILQNAVLYVGVLLLVLVIVKD